MMMNIHLLKYSNPFIYLTSSFTCLKHKSFKSIKIPQPCFKISLPRLLCFLQAHAWEHHPQWWLLRIWVAWCFLSHLHLLPFFHFSQLFSLPSLFPFIWSTLLFFSRSNEETSSHLRGSKVRCWEKGNHRLCICISLHQ